MVEHVSTPVPAHSTTGRFTRREKQYLLLLSLLAFAVRAVLALEPRPDLSPYVDDAYYVFSIARSIAFGHGPTVDYQHLTNGFQPLIAYLYAPLFWIASGVEGSWLAVRLSFLLNGALFVWSIWLLARCVKVLLSKGTADGRDARLGGAVAATLWTFSISVFWHTTNGLETILYTDLLLLVLLQYVRIRSEEAVPESQRARQSMDEWLALGVLLGFTVLARIDAMLLLASICGIEVLRRNARGALLAGIVALLITAPWWFFSYTHFGSLMPTSGQAENVVAARSGENIERAILTLTDIGAVLFYAPFASSRTTILLWAVIVVAGWILLMRRTAVLERFRSSRIGELWPFVPFLVALVIYYTFFFQAPHFIQRYFQPIRIGCFVVIGLVASSVLRAWRSLEARGRIVRQTVLACVLLAGIGFGVDRYSTIFVRQHSDFYRTGEWAASHPEAKVGMLQSGLANFMAINVVNLDGKVNADAVRARRTGTLGAYIARERFDYLCDWPLFVKDIAAMANRYGAEYDSAFMIQSVLVLKRHTASFTP